MSERMVAVKQLGPNTFSPILSIQGMELLYYKQERKMLIKYERTELTLWPGEQTFIVFMGMIRGWLFRSRGNNVVNELTQAVISTLQAAGDLS